eukprot:jgi/Bigna1/126416/aug1.2_g1124
MARMARALVVYCQVILPLAAAPLSTDTCILERTHNSLVRDMDCFKAKNKAFYEDKLRKYEPGTSADKSVCNVHSCNATSYSLREQDPQKYKGHLDYFGKQGQVDPGIEEVEGCMEPDVFLKEYVYRHKPVVMRGCMHMDGGLPDKWTDEYFMSFEEIRAWKPIVETQKTISRNDRGPHVFNMTFEEFLGRYHDDPYYVINSIDPERLRRDFKIPRPMLCERTLRQIDDFHMWFSSGATESSQHFDTHDNLLGMIDGSKQVLMTDPIHSLGLYMDYHDKFGLSPINVRHVDLSVYPLVADLPVIEVNITKGDLLFIPTHWWHQINSFKNDSRNMALSMGWHGLFPVGDVDDNIGFLRQGLKEIKNVPSSDGIFALELMKWSERIRNISYIYENMTTEELCGEILDEATLAEVAMLHDQSWYMYGLGSENLKSGSDFFRRVLIPNAETVASAIAKNLNVVIWPELCSIRATWAFKEEAFVTDFKGPAPTITRHQLNEKLLLDYDLIVFVKDDQSFLTYLNMEWPEKEELMFSLIREKKIRVAVKKDLNGEQRTENKQR